jgi:hypothetical protein
MASSNGELELRLVTMTLKVGTNTVPLDDESVTVDGVVLTIAATSYGKWSDVNATNHTHSTKKTRGGANEDSESPMRRGTTNLGAGGQLSDIDGAIYSHHTVWSWYILEINIETRKTMLRRERHAERGR